MTKTNKGSNTANYCTCCGMATERYLSVETAATLFDLTTAAVRGMVRRREIEFEKLGTRIRIAYSEMKRKMIRYPAKTDFNLRAKELECDGDGGIN